jgi:two-component system sensor histidine kinase/response regulator
MLLDYRMPGMDGVEVARRAIEGGLARTSLSGQETIILMLASDDLNFRLMRMREAGLHTYLIKPVKRAELREKIGHLLGGTGADQPLPDLAEPPAAPADATPLRILLAEDAPDNRFLIKAYLKKLPYRIEIAENGQVAIEKFKATRPDLVLMDVQMPEIDGLAATRAIRQWESEQGLSATPIIALTACARGGLEAQPGRRLRSARQQAGQKTDPAGSDSQGGGDAHGRCRRAGASGRREFGRMRYTESS